MLKSVMELMLSKRLKTYIRVSLLRYFLTNFHASRIPHIMSSFMGEEEGLAKIITLLLTPFPVIKF